MDTQLKRNKYAKQMMLGEIEAPEETSHAVVLQVPEFSYMKEELEEVWIGQEENQLCVKEESSAASFPVSTISIKSENDAETPLFSQLHKHQQEDDCSTSRSSHLLTGIIIEKDFGGAESTWSPSLNTRVEICNSSDTEVSEDDEEYRNMNNPNFELKRSSESDMNDSECESRASVAKGNDVSKSLFCSDCGEQFNKDSLKRHNTQGCSSGLVGKKCFKVTKTVDSQNTVQTIPKSFACDDCGKTFNRKRILNQHKRTHTGEKPFHCDLCGHSFTQKSCLNVHMRIHTGEKPSLCDLCGRSFNQKSCLVRHRRIHTGEKPFCCDLCGHSFTQKSSLKIHMRIHTGEKPLSCDVCGHSCNRKSSLKIHMRIHSGEKPFRCDLCGQSFNQKSNLGRHMVIHARHKLF